MDGLDQLHLLLEINLTSTIFGLNSHNWLPINKINYFLVLTLSSLQPIFNPVIRNIDYQSKLITNNP